MTEPTLPQTPEKMVERVRHSIATSGFSRFLGVELLRCWQGEAEAVTTVREDFSQYRGNVHGGVVAACADNACVWAAASLAGNVVTANLTLHFLRPASGERLRAIGKVVKAGRRQIVVQAEVFAETGTKAELVATALAAVARIDG